MFRFALVALFATACGGSEPAANPAPKPEPTARTEKQEAKSAPAPKPAEAQAPAEGQAAADGKAVYEQHCAACHQADGTGMGGKLAPDFTKDEARLAQADDALVKVVKEGKKGDIGQMPAFGDKLSDDQVKAVVGYMKATFGK